MTTLHHDGLAFHIQLDGPEAAPWMVFSNSLVTDLTVWDHQVAAFANRFRILRYDQRGHGGTAIPTTPATIAQLANDIATIMTQLGAHDAVFAGVSMGAATGFCLAQTAPHLVSHLIASDGQAATAPGGAEAWAARIAIAEQGGMTAYADSTMDRWFSARSHAEANPAIAPVRAIIESTPLQGFIACARALQNFDFRPGLPAMPQPCLMIAGAEDGVMPAGLKALATQVPNGRYVEIADAGHLPCIERPDAFNAALAAFLQ